MVYLYSGTPGSGKSLHLAREIYRFLNRRKDCVVICNFEINLDLVKHPERFAFCPNDELTPEFVIEKAAEFFSSGVPLQENRIILIIDECQVIFNSRNWQDKGRMEWVTFFSQHRKYGVLCYLVAQFDMMIDKQIRAIIEYQVVHRRISNFGNLGFVIRLLLFGDVFIGVERWYSIGDKVGSTLFRARRKYFKLYDTFNTFQISVKEG